MSAGFEQVSRGRWPTGIDKPIATLRAEPEEIARRYPVRFTRGHDELDGFHEVGLRLRSGRNVLLMRYLRSPGPGTTVSVDADDDATAALRELRETLSIGRREVIWVSDEVEEPRGSLLVGLVRKIGGWIGSRRSRHALHPG